MGISNDCGNLEIFFFILSSPEYIKSMGKNKLPKPWDNFYKLIKYWTTLLLLEGSASTLILLCGGIMHHLKPNRTMQYPTHWIFHTFQALEIWECNLSIFFNTSKLTAKWRAGLKFHTRDEQGKQKTRFYPEVVGCYHFFQIESGYDLYVFV